MTSPDPDATSLQPHSIEPGDDLAAIAALEEPNRRRLYELVASAHDDVGRDRAADALGISRELAAFHLDRLVEAGLLEAGYRRLSGRSGPGAGRPAKVYRRAGRELAVSIPPRRYAAIADHFAEGLSGLARDVGPDAVERALAGPARERGRAAGIEARAAAGRRPTHQRLVSALRGLLARAGYEPAPTAAGGLALCNCPYRALAEAHRDLTCSTNLAWAEGLVEGLADGRLEATFTPTAGRCCVTFASEG
jgi:predicted ArsR family transcriptional regulator